MLCLCLAAKSHCAFVNISLCSFSIMEKPCLMPDLRSFHIFLCLCQVTKFYWVFILVVKFRTSVQFSIIFDNGYTLSGATTIGLVTVNNLEKDSVC